ncbi:PKD domain-containing protein [Psychroserpens sp. NJDZ02]|uniref:PKD domain-containing protein n=1 Tax=Psychroserpens sp. NJDZ02 TaxID=2570561 RepID=UPI0010A8921D|nr:PKD domain-containing protein [Psychroserpens sp. NJDZ02]QCE42470.1 PKD domain-containing protein [Psychroserpens sp. NJDZ02]
MAEKNITHYHMDKMVRYLFVFVFLISATVLGFHIKNSSGCNTVLFDTDAKDYAVGEAILFNDLTIDADKWQWSFGDNTSSFQKDPAHYFEKPGAYDVELIVNGSCVGMQTVEIKEAIKVLDSTKFPVFDIPESVRVGDVLKLKDETNNASTWEWRFGETPKIDDKNRTAEYVYTEPGLYTVKLIVNGDVEYMTKKKINVLEPLVKESIIEKRKKRRKNIKDWKVKEFPIGYTGKEDGEEEDEDITPKKITAPPITDKVFSRMIMQVSEGAKTAIDFKVYFCGDINKTVIVNRSTMSFAVFCQKIANRNIKIKSLEVDKQKGTNCIENVSLTYRRTIF